MELNDAIKAYVESHVAKVAEEKGLEKLLHDLTELRDEYMEFKESVLDRLKEIEKSEDRDFTARISRLEYEVRQVKLMKH
ncbi:hypothetical protein L0Y69_00065 [bacterium]|nr:hypothetical protein [bacterium]